MEQNDRLENKLKTLNYYNKSMALLLGYGYVTGVSSGKTKFKNHTGWIK